MKPLRLGSREIDLPGLGLALLLGAAGGSAAEALHLPLGMLLGSLVAVGLVSVAGWRPLGIVPQVPEPLRFCFVPVIGVSIGGAFTPALMREALFWWPSLLALALYLPLALSSGFLIYHRLGGVPKVTAFFGAVPGGLIETVVLGEQAGADGRMVTLLQFLRLILCIVLVPVGFTLATGHAVGSASGVPMTGAAVPIGPSDAAIMLACAVVGYLAGKRLHLPAAIMTGPLLLSALAHLAGLTHTVPPGWAILLTQLVVGSSLGARFAGLPRQTLGKAFGLAAVNGMVSLALAMAFALSLARIVAEPVPAVFLAFAPGGVAEMSLVALSLELSVVYVTLHHVARIVLSVATAQVLARRIVAAQPGEDQ